MNCLTRPNLLNRPTIASELDRMFNDVRAAARSASAGMINAAAATPRVNAWEDEHNLYIESEVPGLTMDNLDISLTGGELSIRGRRETKQDEASLTYHRRERASGEFQRTLRIGVPIDHDKVTASLTNGVLLVTLPKAATAKPRKIEVSAK